MRWIWFGLLFALISAATTQGLIGLMNQSQAPLQSLLDQLSSPVKTTGETWLCGKVSRKEKLKLPALNLISGCGYRRVSNTEGLPEIDLIKEEGRAWLSLETKKGKVKLKSVPSCPDNSPILGQADDLQWWGLSPHQQLCVSGQWSTSKMRYLEVEDAFAGDLETWRAHLRKRIAENQTLIPLMWGVWVLLATSIPFAFKAWDKS